MKYLYILLLSLFLQGCWWNTNPDIVIPRDSVVKLDKEVLTSCPALKEDMLITSFDEVLLAYSDIATKYGICANKQNTSIKLLKEFANIK